MGGGQAFRDVVLRLNRRNWPCSCQVMASSMSIVKRVSIAGSVARTQPTVWKVKLIGRMSKVVGNAELAPTSRKLHSVIDFGAPGCIRSHSVYPCNPWRRRSRPGAVAVFDPSTPPWPGSKAASSGSAKAVVGPSRSSAWHSIRPTADASAAGHD
mgnify:CR=1 FL=1